MNNAWPRSIKLKVKEFDLGVGPRMWPGDRMSPNVGMGEGLGYTWSSWEICDRKEGQPIII